MARSTKLITLLGPPIRLAMTLVADLRNRLPASLRRPGVAGIALTPAGRIVLVRHTYVPGWYPPGGGRKRGERAETAVMRELREEIGLETWSSVEPVEPFNPAGDIFVVRDAIYRPRWSLEIAEVAEFDVDDLPSSTSPRLRRALARLDLREVE